MTHSEPSILSPNGEGYCRHCRFVVGLEYDGMLDFHVRGSVTDYGARGVPEKCKGSGTKPAKVTPYAASKSRFITRMPKAFCPLCRQRVSTRIDGRFASHRVAPGVAPPCHGGYKLIDGG